MLSVHLIQLVKEKAHLEKKMTMQSDQKEIIRNSAIILEEENSLIIRSNNLSFTFDAESIVKLAVKAVFEKVSECSKNSYQGKGTLDNPYVAETALGLLSLAYFIMDGTDFENKTSYISLDGRIIKYRHQDRYVSDVFNNKLEINDHDLADILKPGKKANKPISIPDWAHLNREKFAFILNYFNKDVFIKVDRKEGKPGEYYTERKPKIESHKDLIEIIDFIFHFSIATWYYEVRGNINIEEDRFIFSINEGKDFKKEEIKFPGFLQEVDRNSIEEFVNKFYGADSERLSNDTNLVYLKNDENKGPTYSAFHSCYKELISILIDYYKLNDIINNKIETFSIQKMNCFITRYMFFILGNQEMNLSEEELIHIKEFSDTFPLLLSSFFIAETGRNPVTFLSSLVLMELILKYNSDGAECSILDQFSWLSTLNPENGIYPMVHQGSFSDEFATCKRILMLEGVDPIPTTDASVIYIRPDDEGKFSAWWFEDNEFKPHVIDKKYETDFKNQTGEIANRQKDKMQFDLVTSKCGYAQFCEAYDYRWNLKKPLTPTREKEANLFIKWLALKINGKEKEKIERIILSTEDDENKRENICKLIEGLFKERVSSFGLMLPIKLRGNDAASPLNQTGTSATTTTSTSTSSSSTENESTASASRSGSTTTASPTNIAPNAALFKNTTQPAEIGKQEVSSSPSPSPKNSSGE